MPIIYSPWLNYIKKSVLYLLMIITSTLTAANLIKKGFNIKTLFNKIWLIWRFYLYSQYDFRNFRY